MQTLQEISRDGRAFYIHMMIFNFFFQNEDGTIWDHIISGSRPQIF